MSYHLQIKKILLLKNNFLGIMLVALFATTATLLSNLDHINKLSLSPLIIGIGVGTLYSITIRRYLPEILVPGIMFSSKRVLRVAIVLYGFRLSLQQIIDVGVFGITAAIFMLTTTMLLGFYTGTKLLKMDKDISLLIAAGSAICGAAAILAVESVLNSKPHKSVTAVTMIIVFGTIAMFLYPALHSIHLLPLDNNYLYAIFVGSTIHEVAQVTAAGNAIAGAANTAIVVKMIRVMLLAPVLIIISFVFRKETHKNNLKDIIPWFALGFIAIVAFNSLNLLPTTLVQHINAIDTFLLTMAMTALGMEMNFDRLKKSGLKPVLLAIMLAFWLFFGGLLLINL